MLHGLRISDLRAVPVPENHRVGIDDMAGKPLLTVMLTDDLVKKGRNASNMVREAAKEIKGGGGGQPGFAQAGGKDKEGIVVAGQKLMELIKG